MPHRSRWSGGDVAGVTALVGVVTAMTIARSVHAVSARTVAASPASVFAGKCWLLLSSGLMVDRPVVVSLATLAAFAAFALAVCGSRILWWSAAIGHVGSAAIVYLLIGLTRVVAVSAFDRVLAAPDYGVSAIQAGWLGAMATVVCLRDCQTIWRRLPVALACAAFAACGWALRPDLNVISSEHLIAFLFGIAVARRLVAGSRPTREVALHRNVHRVRRRRLIGPGLVTAIVLVSASAAAATVYPSLAGPLRDSPLRTVDTTAPDVALIIEAPGGAVPGLANTLAAAGESATFALTNPPEPVATAMLAAQRDDAIPIIQAGLITHWLSTRRQLRHWRHWRGHGRDLYYLAGSRALTLADEMLLHANDGLPVTGPDINALPPTSTILPGQVLLVGADRGSSPAAVLGHALGRLRRSELSAVSLEQLLRERTPLNQTRS